MSEDRPPDADASGEAAKSGAGSDRAGAGAGAAAADGINAAAPAVSAEAPAASVVPGDTRTAPIAAEGTTAAPVAAADGVAAPDAPDAAAPAAPASAEVRAAHVVQGDAGPVALAPGDAPAAAVAPRDARAEPIPAEGTPGAPVESAPSVATLSEARPAAPGPGDAAAAPTIPREAPASAELERDAAGGAAAPQPSEREFETVVARSPGEHGYDLGSSQPLRAATRPGATSEGMIVSAVRSLWEEIVYPRARLKAALRRAEHHGKRYPAASASALALFVGIPFFMYMPVGLGPGVAAWLAFVGAALFLIVGGPLLLIYTWPVALASVVGGSVWLHCSLGEGALWLGVATVGAMLIFYFATTEVVPFAAAALVAWAVHRHGVALSGPAFAVACAFFLYHRSRLTGPLLCAGWVVISGIASSHIALAMLGETTPPVWLRGPIPGPAGMTTWIASVAVIAALLVVPRKRESRRRKRVKTIFEQLPP